MTGLNDTDIRLNSEWQLTQATDGDAPLCSGLECLYQNIVLEALTQPGDVFYHGSDPSGDHPAGAAQAAEAGGHPPGKH